QAPRDAVKRRRKANRRDPHRRLATRSGVLWTTPTNTRRLGLEAEALRDGHDDGQHEFGYQIAKPERLRLRYTNLRHRKEPAAAGDEGADRAQVNQRGILPE